MNPSQRSACTLRPDQPRRADYGTLEQEAIEWELDCSSAHTDTLLRDIQELDDLRFAEHD